MAGDSDFDGFAILAEMARRPDLFREGRAEAAKAARTIVTKQIKASGLALDHLRAIRGALGPGTFVQILDGLKPAEVKALAKRLDAQNPDLKAMSEADALRHLGALADDLAPTTRAAPSPRATRATKATGASKAAGARAPREAKAAEAEREESLTGRTLTSKAMAARSPRRKAIDRG